MTVPTQAQLHRPILEIVCETHGGSVVSLKQIRESLIERLGLTEYDLREKVPSGGQTRFENRAYWAVSYLKRANLLHSPSRAQFQITQQGRKFLTTHEGDITGGELNRLIAARQQQTDDEFAVDSTTTNAIGVPDTAKTIVSDFEDGTPDEHMDALHRELNDRLAYELLESAKGMAPDRFEDLVVELLEEMGYGEGEAIGRSGDEGIDGIVNQDPLGLEKVYIQAKRWQNQVGEPEIRNFSGSLEAKGASKGVFITTSNFSSTAEQTARYISAGNKFIRLIGGHELARLMINHGVGVVTETTYEVKKIDENYFVDL